MIVLGDARTNMSDPNLPAVRQIARSPPCLLAEPGGAGSQWGTGDSAAPDYAEVVEMHECRNARQLSALVTRLLPV